MGKTNTLPESETQATASAETKKIDVATRTGEPVLTAYTVANTEVFPVRVSKSGDAIAMRLDTTVRREQRQNEEDNESIRRRLRG